MKMTVQHSIIIGAALVACAVLGGQLVAPYRMTASGASVWRINTVTGEVRECYLGAHMVHAELVVSDCR